MSLNSIKLGLQTMGDSFLLLFVKFYRFSSNFQSINFQFNSPGKTLLSKLVKLNAMTEHHNKVPTFKITKKTHYWALLIECIIIYL